VLPEGARPERLVEAEPVLLDVDIGAVLAEIRRLLPGQDEVKVSGLMVMTACGPKGLFLGRGSCRAGVAVRVSKWHGVKKSRMLPVE